MARTPRVSLLAAFALVALVVWACGRNPLNPLSFTNRPPEVRILAAPSAIAGESVTHEVRWEASDADGRVDHYLVAVTPSTQRGTPTWSRSEQASLAVTLPTKQAAKRAHGAVPVAEPEFTIVSVRAVDDRGGVSEPAQLALFAENHPPTVRITAPLPSSLTTALVPGHFDIRWVGTDSDGNGNQPTAYRHRLFTDGPAPADFGFPVIEANFIDFIRSNPDSFRRGYAPSFPGWTTVGSATRDLHLEGLTVASSYLFAITAFDDAGDYDPIFNLNKNLLRMYVIPDDDARPALHLFNEFFDYRYSNGSLSTDPSRQIPLTIRSDQRVTIRWDATAAPSAAIVKTRASLSLEGGPTPIGGEWSRWLGQHSIQVGPFPDGQVRLLYVEIEDNRGLTSIGIVRIHPVNLTAKRPLLIVDDTRLLPDNLMAGGVIPPPSGAWPTAAELDTFLFAVGGFPWRGYPVGTTSTPGIFAGYDYDTLGTRIGRNDLTVPLETLARYENVIWIVDQEGAGNTWAGTNPLRPMTALRYMTAVGRYNSLAAYVELGGRLWLTGGGAARATLLDWSVPNTSPQLCSNEHELIAGRMMYDQAHWRSCITAASVSTSGRLVKSPGLAGNWPGGPDYASFPAELLRRSAPSDPVPPLRQPSSFYPAFFWYEYLSMPNGIVEPHIGTASVLDTIYQVGGGTVPAGVIRPTMTLYHGNENAPVIFSGFDLWSFRRSDCVQLLDAVLGSGWGLPRQTTTGARRIASAAPPSPEAGGTR